MAGSKEAIAENRAIQQQMHLFSVPTGRGNTLLDYDLIPRFIHDKANKCVILNGSNVHFGRKIEINQDETYEIMPAVINQEHIVDGEKTTRQCAIYPGTRESVIEDCLIGFVQNGEFSLEKGEPGYRTDGRSVGVCFTLYQLRLALKERGKEYKLTELKEGLDVLQRSTFSSRDTNGRERSFGYIIESMDSIPNPITSDKLRADRIVHITFESRASKRILEGHYRSYDAKVALAMRSPVARYLYKRFTHYWQQANKKGQTGSVKGVDQNEIILASGCVLSRNPTKRKNVMLKAIEELAAVGIIEEFFPDTDLVPVKHGRKVVDNTFMVRPTHLFINQQIEGYKRLQKTKRIGSDVLEAIENTKIKIETKQ